MVLFVFHSTRSTVNQLSVMFKPAESSASSQTGRHVDGAEGFNVIVRECFPICQLSVLVDEPLLVCWDPLSALHPFLEVPHGLMRFDIIGALLPL